MRIDQPLNMSPFYSFDVDAKGPRIKLETAITGAHSWSWTIRWKTFSQSGGMSTAVGRFELDAMVGGDLSVQLLAGGRSFVFNAPIIGQNPTHDAIRSYVNGKPDADGFLDIIMHESKGKHFNLAGQPIESFDHGFGLCQLTRPAPTYEQVWNWKRNIDAGLTLFADKRRIARNFLSSHGSYTPDQLKRETVARWNGGPYHSWDGSKWIRRPNILCDGKTGNIGWDMSDPDNAGKTASELRARDQSTYRRGHQNTDEWNYFGVCYADALLR